jgi:hypothetical protein
MHPLVRAGLAPIVFGVAAVGIYEISAKSPSFPGGHLPGWEAADRAEHSTRWDPRTGILPLDKILHEGQEAVRFYADLTGLRS